MPDNVRMAVLCDHGEGRPRLVDRIMWNPETGHAMLAQAPNTEQVVVDGQMTRKYRIRCRCGLDVPLRQANLNLVAAGLYEAGESSVELSHLARAVANLGG